MTDGADESTHALASLTQWERDYISLRYGLKDGVHRSLEEVAMLLGWSVDRAKKTETLSLTKMGPNWQPPRKSPAKKPKPR